MVDTILAELEQADPSDEELEELEELGGTAHHRMAVLTYLYSG